MPEGTIEVDNLIKTFATGRKALDGISLSVKPGEMVALIGASGSGKSTLLRHLAGFVAGDRTSRAIVVNGRTVQADGVIEPRVRQVRAGIGFVFQQFNLVGQLSVMNNVLAGMLHRLPHFRTLLFRFSAQERLEASRAMAAVDIEGLAWQRASTLSGGQQQRAAIARVLVQRAPVILADEPIASLDPESALNIMEILARLNGEHGRTVLVSLHQVDYALRFCPRTIALRSGKVVFDGPSAQLTPALLRTLYGNASREPQPLAVEGPARDEGSLPVVGALA